MRTRRTLLLIIGCVFVIYNIWGDLFFAMNTSIDEKTAGIPDGEKVGFWIGYFLGQNFLLVTGLVLLYLAYRTNRKIDQQQKKDFIDSY